MLHRLLFSASVKKPRATRIYAGKSRAVAMPWKTTASITAIISRCWDASGITRELQTAQDTLTAITGQRPLFFRAPAGLRNPLLDPVLARLGLRLASWSARGFDTRIGDAERVKYRLLRGLRAGAILLLHDGNAARTPEGIPVILEVLPTVLAAAKAADLRFVTLRLALS